MKTFVFHGLVQAPGSNLVWPVREYQGELWQTLGASGLLSQRPWVEEAFSVGGDLKSVVKNM